ncbi:MAG: hypothetical protein AB4050_09475 [Synechococcus sp.]
MKYGHEQMLNVVKEIDRRYKSAKSAENMGYGGISFFPPNNSETVAVSNIPAIERLYNAEVFHVHNDTLLAEKNAVEGVIGLSQIETATCYQVLLVELSAISVMGELINRIVKDERIPDNLPLPDLAGQLHRMLIPRHQIVIYTPFPVSWKDEMPDRDATIEEIAAFVEKRNKQMFAGNVNATERT